MIGLWLSKQGSICPLTGQPLVEAQLKADDKVKQEVKAWQKHNTLQSKRSATASATGNNSTKGKAIVATGVRGKQQQRRGSSSPSSSGRGAKTSADTSNSDRLLARPAVAVTHGLGDNDLETTAPAKDGNKGRRGSGRSGSGEDGDGRESKNVDDEDDIYNF